MADTLERVPEMTKPAGSPHGSLEPRDLVLAVVGGAMVVFAIVLLVMGGERDTGAGAVATAAPRLAIVHPVPGAEVTSPLTIVFDVGGNLERLPGGWGVGELHLHLELNGREFMPGAREIERLPNGTYAWTLARVVPGDVELRLFWAGPDHAPLESGASAPVRAQAR
jgi:hypothetical protein